MPAVKRELPGREDLALALAAFHPALAALPLPPLPSYLAPLPGAAALPPAASLPAAAAGYEALLAPPLRPPRAYLSLHEAAPRLHLPRDPLAVERLSAPSAAVPPDFQPLLDHGEPCIEVECGANRALLYVRRLCQGSKGPSIRHRGEWLTPNEFQFVSGRETAKDWKRSIRHKGAGRARATAAFLFLGLPVRLSLSRLLALSIPLPPPWAPAASDPVAPPPGSLGRDPEGALRPQDWTQGHPGRALVGLPGGTRAERPGSAG